MAQWCNPLPLQPEQSDGVGSMPGSTAMERKGSALDMSGEKSTLILLFLLLYWRAVWHMKIQLSISAVGLNHLSVMKWDRGLD